MATRFTSSSSGFIIALILVIAWGLAGHLFHYSHRWEVLINGCNLIIFLMVFLIRKAQRKHSLAIRLKLNELLMASKSASNLLVHTEKMTEQELKIIKKYYSQLNALPRGAKNKGENRSTDKV